MAEENTGRKGGVGLAIGAKVGKYEVVQRMAIGGQAVVYKGYDPVLDRHVAIKQISTHLAEDAKFLERFRKEAQILARLGSEQPAIVTIHEMIEQTEGLFIVMEYVAGHSLETVLNDTKGPIELKAALQVLFRLAAALHDVHAAGIIHRDIKPANIIICEGLRPKITDFGVAATSSGQTSMVLGTTKYMAPELFAGGDVDARADVYSLGIIAYEMLVGRAKFNEIFADIVRDPHSEALRWMKWHGNPDLVAPPVGEVNPAVPEALSDIVGRMTAKDRQQRFASMEELGRAIKLAFSPRARAAPVAAAPAGRRWRRRPAAAGGDAGEEKSELEPRDGADELEVPAEEAPTSRLPGKGLSLRTKLILAGVVFLSVLGLVVGLAIRRNMAKSRQAAAVKQAFEDARKHFHRNRLPEAVAALKELREKFPGTRQAAKASVLVCLYQAHLAMAQADTNDAWEQQAADRLKEARGRLKEVQRSRDDLDKWVAAVEREIEELDEKKDKTRTFRRAMQNARAALEQQQFDQARDFLRGTDVVLTSAQQKSVEDFIRKIDLEEFWTVYNRHTGAGDARLADAEKTGALETFAEADAAYGKAAQWLDSAKADVLDVEQRRQLAGELAKKRRELAARRDYRAAIIAADRARKDGKRREELARLQAAYAIKPAPALGKRIGAIRSEIAFEQADAALARGRYAQAEKLLKEALRQNPDNARAAEALAQLRRGARRRRLVAAGDRALAAGEHQAALESFQAAAKIQPDDELKAKIVECRFRIQLADARKLRRAAESHRPPVAKEYDDALAAYEKARGIKPSAGEIVAAEIATMRRRQHYEQWAARAAAAEAGSRWQTMIEAWTQAKKIRDTTEAAQGIARAKYGDYLARGRDAMAVEDFRGALGWFQLAKAQVPKAGIAADEVDRLIAEVKKKLRGHHESSLTG